MHHDGRGKEKTSIPIKTETETQTRKKLQHVFAVDWKKSRKPLFFRNVENGRDENLLSQKFSDLFSDLEYVRSTEQES